MHADERGSKLTENVLGAAFEIANTLGCGFLEKVYERAMVKELALRGLSTRSQVPFSISYKAQSIGDYFVDLLVDDQLVVELKCVDNLSREHMAQCINYLKASRVKVALLINFQKPKLEWKRIVYRL